MNIGLVQMISEKGAVDDNLAQTLRHIEAAYAHGVDILAFPEANLTGYADPAIHPEAALTLESRPVQTLLAHTQGLAMVVLIGIIESNGEDKPYITQLAMRDGELLGCYRKMTISEDEDWFELGTTVTTFTHTLASANEDTVPEIVRFGVAICADISNEAVFAGAAQQGAQIVFELAAPGLYGEQATRNWRSGFEWWANECETYLPAYTRTYGIWAAVATQAGRTSDEDFPGGGYVFSPDGRRLYATPNWSPAPVYLSLDLDTQRVTPL